MIMAKKESESFALMATALNRIAIALESIDARQQKHGRKRIVLKARGRQ